MRTLFIMGGCCIALAGILAWRFLNGRTAKPESATGSVEHGPAAVNAWPSPAEPRNPATFRSDIRWARADRATRIPGQALRGDSTITSADSPAPPAKGPADRAVVPGACDAELIAALEAAVAAAEWERAIDLAAELAARRPGDPAAHFEYASLLMRRQRFVEADAVLRRVLNLAPEHAKARFNLAVVCQVLGRLGEARDLWNRFLAAHPDDAEAHAHRGEALLDLHDWDAAAADFAWLARRDPADAAAALNLSLALEQLGRGAEAIAILTQRIERRPSDVRLMNRLAALEWADSGSNPRSDSARRAAEWCRRSLALLPDQPAIIELLGQIVP